MKVVVNMMEAKTQLSSLVERAVNGDEVVIANRGRPKVVLTPVSQPAERPLGFMLGPDLPASFFEPMFEDELTLWES